MDWSLLKKKKPYTSPTMPQKIHININHNIAQNFQCTSNNIGPFYTHDDLRLKKLETLKE